MNRFNMLKLAKKKRGLTIRDFWYFDLEELVHEGLLHKTLPARSRAPGWPLYIISQRGRKSLAKEYARNRR
jgi:hypothetical protein